jgi:hypothetical protein
VKTRDAAGFAGGDFDGRPFTIGLFFLNNGLILKQTKSIFKVRLSSQYRDVDGRDEPGHDDGTNQPNRKTVLRCTGNLRHQKFSSSLIKETKSFPPALHAIKNAVGV